MDPLPAPVHPGEPGRKTVILGVSWTLTPLAIFCVIARIWIRSQPPTKLGWDDYTIILAAVIQVFHQAAITIACHYGAGMHDADLTLDQTIHILMWFWISTTPSLVVSVVTRLSSAILLTRIFKSVDWFRWFLLVFSILQCIGGALAIISVYEQASPIQSLWDPLIPATRTGDHEFEVVATDFAQSLFAFTDLTYVFIPVSIIWRLNMPLRRKIGLIIILSLSLVSFVGSVMKAVTAAFANNLFESSLVILWSNLEQTINIMVSCVPALRTIILSEIPIVRTVGASLIRLVTRMSSESSMGSRDTRQSNRGYRDLEGKTGQRRKPAQEPGLSTFDMITQDQVDAHDSPDIELTAYKAQSKSSDRIV
ncbi:hypothetical protein F5Y16DRAFT_390803 [Xylariaceae sp. FL0255]|nr:hypothetical protein F5Y16DRAFT_390803 [Xylariaceae sp. FL0255]